MSKAEFVLMQCEDEDVSLLMKALSQSRHGGRIQTEPEYPYINDCFSRLKIAEPAFDNVRLCWSVKSIAHHVAPSVTIQSLMSMSLHR